jgi:hypothetical protein
VVRRRRSRSRQQARRVSIDNALPYYVDTFAVTLPAGASGPLGHWRLQGRLRGDRGVSTSCTTAPRWSRTPCASARASCTDLVWTVAYDGVRNYSFPSLCKKTDGSYLAVYRDGLGHASNDGISASRRIAPTSSTWTNYRTIVNFAATGQ